MVRISAATLNIPKCDVVLLSALKQMSIKTGGVQISRKCSSNLKILDAKGWHYVTYWGPQTLGASVQNLVVMATWLLGLEHLQIRKLPRPSKFFPVHHSPTSPPDNDTPIQQNYPHRNGWSIAWGVEPRTLPATGLNEAESYLKTVVQPITKFPVFDINTFINCNWVVTRWQ